MTAYGVYSHFLNISKIVDYEALKPEPISLVETVKALRQQRHPWMVEGESQYTFAYVVILHLLQELACYTPSKNESLLQALSQ